MSVQALDARSQQWENSSGLPIYYFINFSSRTKIGFAPFPNSSSDLATIDVDYFAYSNELSKLTDIPFGNAKEFYAYHYALVYYAAYRMALVDERAELAGVFLTQFENLTALAKDLCIARENYYPSMVGKKTQ